MFYVVFVGGTRWNYLAAFEADVISERNFVDNALIFGCKRLVATFLINNKDKEFNGLKLSDAILPSFPDVK